VLKSDNVLSGQACQSLKAEIRSALIHALVRLRSLFTLFEILRRDFFLSRLLKSNIVPEGCEDTGGKLARVTVFCTLGLMFWFLSMGLALCYFSGA